MTGVLIVIGDLFRIFVFLLKSIIGIVEVYSTARGQLPSCQVPTRYLHDHKLHLVCFNLLSDLRHVICIHWTPSICYKDYLPLVLQLLAVLRDHLDGNDNSRYCLFHQYRVLQKRGRSVYHRQQPCRSHGPFVEALSSLEVEACKI